MTKRLAKLLAACLALALLLTACAPKKDAITRSKEAFAAVDSMHYSMKIDMSFTSQGESLNFNTNAEVDYIADPITAKMKLNTDMMGLYNSAAIEYLVKNTDSEGYTIYIELIEGGGNVSWYKMNSDDLGDFSSYNGQEAMSAYLDNFSDFTEAGTEDIDGVTAVRYDGVVTRDSMQAVLDASGINDMYESMNIDLGSMDEIIDELGDIPVSIWIDETTDLPVKYEVNMSDMMQKMFDKLMTMDESTAGTELAVDKCSVTMVCSDYNSVAPIEIPQEALDAQSVDGLLGQ